MRTGRGSTIKRCVKASMHCLCVAVAICSWFAISNHCALAALATNTASVGTTCPFHSKPAKQPNQSTQAQCCKILRAIASVPTKSGSADSVKLARADCFCSERALTVSSFQTAPEPQSLDTGPPGTHSFAELILQRSLLAHAPPCLA